MPRPQRFADNKTPPRRKRIIYSALIGMTAFALFIAPVQTRALEKQGDVTADDISAAESYAALASAFGQDQLALIAVDRDNLRMMMEFISNDETLANWSRMVTINLMALPTDASEKQRKEAIYSYMDMFRGMVAAQQKSGMAVAMKNFSVFGDAPPSGKIENADLPRHALYHFAVGKEQPDEDNAGIISPQGRWLMNFQIQRRDGVVVTPDEIETLKALLMSSMDTEKAEKAEQTATADAETDKE